MKKPYKLKKRFHFYLYYLVFLFFGGFLCLNFFLPVFNIPELDLRTMISVVSFLFGFLISVSFTMVFSRASHLRDSLASETAELVSIFYFSKYFGKQFHEWVVDKIDQYTITTLRDYSNYDSGRVFAYGLYEDLFKIKPTDSQTRYFSSLSSAIEDFERVRERLEALTSERLLVAQKIANYILGGLLITLLFLNRGEVFTNTLFVILSTIIVFIILIIEDFDNLKIGDYVNNVSNAEQLFDLMGKDRYYPKEILGRAKLRKGATYRIGIYNSETRSEKILELSYTPLFKENLRKLINKFSIKSKKKNI